MLAHNRNSKELGKDDLEEEEQVEEEEFVEDDEDEGDSLAMDKNTDQQTRTIEQNE